MTSQTPPAADLGALLADGLATAARAGDAMLLRATVRLLWQERTDGHVCLSLTDWQQRSAEVDGPPFPPEPAWAEALCATGLCGEAGADDDPADGTPLLPLVLDHHRLYLRRDFAAERTIVRAVQRRLASPELRSAAALREDLGALGLLPAAGAAIDWQLVAIAAAVRGSFLVLTGGPGTGKTTTVARALAVLLRRENALRIALCAPTGKAAARLHEALRQRATAEPALAAVAARCQPTTLHRLLGYLPVEDRFRVDREHPLRYDVVVVDEASMADPALLAVLCSALPDTARLLLVGDRDQLAAVAAGQVLGDVCRAAAAERGPGAALADFVAAATGMQLPTRREAPPIADAVVTLQHSHRFGTRPGIGGFAAALARRDAPAALAALHAGHADLVPVGSPEAALAPLQESLLRAAHATTDDVARHLAGVRILTATRHGPAGSQAWNARVETLLRAHGVRVDDPYYPGRPVLVTANDHQNHVYNGDLGVVVRDAQGRPHVAFPRGDGTLRLLLPRRLPAHETAWAMTVHKAQGSEFDEVLLVLPDKPGPWWQAPLLYTGVTRARQRALLLADPTLLPPALTHWPVRGSGLADALAAKR